MKKNTPYLVAILVALIGFFVYSQSTAITPSPEQTQEISESTENYIPYTEQLFTSSSDKRRVLYFYSNWCSTCRPANANFEENSNKIPDDVVVYRINYNDSDTDQIEKDLAKKYQITYQHTFVQVDKEGNVVTRWNGGELSELISKIK